MNESEKTSSNIIPFFFNDSRTNLLIALQESCWIDGKPYFTGQAIGDFLEYNHPRRSINNIIERNPHINDKAWSVDIKLMSTDGKMYVTRVYDPIAFQLIINKSNQPKAIALQVAVAHLVVAFLNGSLADFKLNELDGSYENLFKFCHMVTSITSVPVRNKMILSCATKNGFTVAKICNMIRQRTGVSLPSPRQTRRKNPDEYATAMAYHQEHPLSGGLCIKRTLGLTASERTINQWIREAMLCAA